MVVYLTADEQADMQIRQFPILFTVIWAVFTVTAPSCGFVTSFGKPLSEKLGQSCVVVFNCNSDAAATASAMLSDSCSIMTSVSCSNISSETVIKL